MCIDADSSYFVTGDSYSHCLRRTEAVSHAPLSEGGVSPRVSCAVDMCIDADSSYLVTGDSYSHCLRRTEAVSHAPLSEGGVSPRVYGTPKWSKIGQRIVAYRGVYLNVAACI